MLVQLLEQNLYEDPVGADSVLFGEFDVMHDGPAN